MKRCRSHRFIIILFILSLVLVISYISVQEIWKQPLLKLRNTPLNDATLCPLLFDGNKTSSESARLWTFQQDSHIDAINNSYDKCKAITNMFHFFTTPLSEEELAFPLAYGMLVHKDPIQVMYLLSAIYQPQNQFCIAVDGKSSEEFYQIIQLLSKCYPNIHVFRCEGIEWCGYSILTSVFSCVQYLSNLTSPWKYYQYLSGVDAPLKTNLEMVRILKALNGSFNAEILPFEFYRLNRKKPWESPIPLVKTSLSATFSRESANFMVNSQLVLKEVEYLKGTLCSDESLWATIAGNPNVIPMPGGFDADEFLWRKFRFIRPRLKGKIPESLKKEENTLRIGTNENSLFDVEDYYISRYQIWVNRRPSRCKGRFYRLSCIFGIDDLPYLVRRHELVAHKMYLDFEPAAFFCLIEEIRLRSLSHNDFDASSYASIPDSPIRVH